VEAFRKERRVVACRFGDMENVSSLTQKTI
jgi:hypothetical protein